MGYFQEMLQSGYFQELLQMDYFLELLVSELLLEPAPSAEKKAHQVHYHVHYFPSFMDISKIKMISACPGKVVFLIKLDGKNS
jgi:hypothetical protein